MKRKSIFSLLLFVLAISLHAQAGSNIDIIQSQVNPTQYGGVMIGKALPPTTLKGDPFLFGDYEFGSIVINDKVIGKEYYLNFNLITNQLILKKKGDDELIGLGSDKIRGFETAQGRQFYVIDSLMDKGVFELIAKRDDNLVLYNLHGARLKRPNYVEGLDVGERNPTIVKENDSYIFNGESLVRIRNKKSLIEAFKNCESCKMNIKKIKKAKDINALKTFIESN